MPSTALSGAVQPPLLTLLSSTSIPPLSPLFIAHTNPEDQINSYIEVLPDISPSRTGLPKETPRGTLSNDVIHIQSPDITSTYIQAGCTLADQRRRREKGKMRDMDDIQPLGIEASWIGLHVRPLGRRDFALELGVVDSRGKEGVIRISTFKKTPSIHLDRALPLLHLPLNIPSKTASTLTQWLHLAFDLNLLIPLFQSLPRNPDHPTEDGKAKRRKLHNGEIPSGRLGFVSYLKVYANCRVRRIWFSEEGEKTLRGLDRAGQEEWALYAAEAA